MKGYPNLCICFLVFLMSLSSFHSPIDSSAMDTAPSVRIRRRASMMADVSRRESDRSFRTIIVSGPTFRTPRRTVRDRRRARIYAAERRRLVKRINDKFRQHGAALIRSPSRFDRLRKPLQDQSQAKVRMIELEKELKESENKQLQFAMQALRFKDQLVRVTQEKDQQIQKLENQLKEIREQTMQDSAP